MVVLVLLEEGSSDLIKAVVLEVSQCKTLRIFRLTQPPSQLSEDLEVVLTAIPRAGSELSVEVAHLCETAHNRLVLAHWVAFLGNDVTDQFRLGFLDEMRVQGPLAVQAELRQGPNQKQSQ